jgi:urease accessory protein
MFAVISRSETDMGVVVAGRATDAPVCVPVLQRSIGAVDLAFSRRNESSIARRAFQQGAMKVRFPSVGPSEPPEAVLINLAGGLTGGDRLEFGATLDARSSAVVTTQACERIYRSTGNDAAIVGRIRLEAETSLDWLPQATIFFDGARLTRETHVELSGDASLLAVECLIFGRTARGESVVSGAISDSWFVHRDDSLIHADRFAIEGDIQTALNSPSVLNGSRAMTTLRYIAPDAEERIEYMRACLADAPEESGTISAASAWNGMMLVRFVAVDGYRLIREVSRILAGFRRKAMPRVWLM